MNLPVILFSILLGIGMIAVAVLTRRANVERRNRFGSRPNLTVEDLCAQYFPNHSLAVVSRCLGMISDVTQVEVGRLRPVDRLDKELRLPSGFCVAGEWDDIEDEIAKKYRKQRCPKKIETIEDFVELMGKEH